MDPTNPTIPNASGASTEDFFEKFCHYVDLKLETIKDEIVEEVVPAKRRKIEQSSQLRYPGNADQYKFNMDILDDLENSVGLFNHPNRFKKDKVHDELKSLCTKIKRRNKLIRLADKSIAGWDTVKEYMSDELASDSEDGKKIRQAEVRAVRKRQEKSKRKINPSLSENNSSTQSTSTHQSSVQRVPTRSSQATYTRSQIPGRRNPANDTCFRCSGVGHWAVDCPFQGLPGTSSTGDVTVPAETLPDTLPSQLSGTGIWRKIQEISHPNLSRLANSFPDFILKSRADSTRKNYSCGYKRWAEWCRNSNVNPLPAEDRYVALYLFSLADQGGSFSQIDLAFHSISWAHDLASFSNPCSSRFILLARDSARRIVGRSISKKEPITPEILGDLVRRFGTQNSSLYDVRTVCMCLIAFSGFLRFSELSNLTRDCILFHEDYVSLSIPKSKTDIFRDGSTVKISKTGNPTCPFNMLKRYLFLAKIPDNSKEFIFRSLSLCKSNSSYKLRKNVPLSYTRTRELLLEKIAELGLNPKEFSLHSLRSGGATIAANTGVPDRLFKKHGRWRSENAKDGYVKDDLKHTLSVSLNLGL